MQDVYKRQVVDGVDKREFYVAQQKKAADFANKVHTGEITNENGEKFTTCLLYTSFLVRLSLGSGTGTAERSVCVYGWIG